MQPTGTPADPYGSAGATYRESSGPIRVPWCDLLGSPNGAKPLQTNPAPLEQGGQNSRWAGPSGPMRICWCNLPGISGRIWGGGCKLLGPQRTHMVRWCNLLAQQQRPYGSAAEPYGSAGATYPVVSRPYVKFVPSGAAAQFTGKS